MLETVERLAELHIKYTRIRELAEIAWGRVRTKPEMRLKARIYEKARKVLSAEIRRLELLLDAELMTDEAKKGL